jgi:uncharacterized protein with NAD-binding domain and iron-sulfur cluster
VIILGGGVGGLSAAHELVERGFDVTVLEKRAVPGGKARSMDVPGSAVPPNGPLPGEHGFRFFPHFYRHIIDTMSRIPVGSGNAEEQLVYASNEMLARFDYPPITFPAHIPRTRAEIEAAIRLMFTDEHTGLVEDDYLFFADRVWRLMTCCPERALDEYENESWWSFMDAKQRSPAFVHWFVEGVTRCLVAAKARVANTRAGGVVMTQLIYGSFSSDPSFDRVLDGPTSDVWIHPWRDYLVGRGVRFHFNTEITGIACDGKRITGYTAKAAPGAEAVVHRGDHYVCALPIEYTAPLLTKEILTADPSLAGILKIAGNVYDMTGIQFYLETDVPLVNGHMSMIDSPWALTGISQHQFWPKVDFAHLGDGKAHGILSIDISEWDEPGLCFPGPKGKNLTARECTKDQVAQDVWTQMRRSLTQADGTCPLPAQHPRFFIDPGMVFDPTPVSNDSRLFVNEVDSWKYRPEAKTAIPNFVLASDYVRTFTNLATMEAANEAARRAVNALLEESGVKAAPCQLWPLPVPPELWPFIEFDKLEWELGRAWSGMNK